jgi:hypothetical protein
MGTGTHQAFVYNIIERDIIITSSFAVRSQTSDKTYEVRLLGADDRYVCTCPDFEYRQIDACKHIHAIKLWIAVRTQLRNEPKPKVFAEDAIPCDRYGSIRTMKYGKSGSKQVYYCKDCHRKNLPYSKRLGLTQNLLPYS